LERTTDVEELFPTRFREEEESGQKVKHWYAVDFTLAEIKQLDAGSWFSAQFKGERIPTFAEAISEIKDKAGLYTELKDPEFYRARGFDMETLVLNELKKYELDKPGSNKKTPVILQSFSDASLRRLSLELKTKLPLVLLIGLGDDKWLSAASILEVSQFAQSLGLAKEALTQEVVERIHRYDLTISVYSFSSKKTSKFPSVNEEMKHYLYKLGVDAVFTDNPDQFPR
jgi:glycerophosphoryl diester phosphodiesterase